jgi:hypothetical protein
VSFRPRVPLLNDGQFCGVIVSYHALAFLSWLSHPQAVFNSGMTGQNSHQLRRGRLQCGRGFSLKLVDDANIRRHAPTAANIGPIGELVVISAAAVQGIFSGSIQGTACCLRLSLLCLATRAAARRYPLAKHPLKRTARRAARGRTKSRGVVQPQFSAK